jgi:hypothetical protein
VRTLIMIAVLAGTAGAAEVHPFIPVVWSPPTGYGPTLSDIASRLPQNTDARDADLITYCHEGSHFLSKGRRGYHGLYIGAGERWWIPTPPLVTEEVLARVPREERGTLWKTYNAQGRAEYWVRQPLMILDEWNAYTHGSMTRQEIAIRIRRETDVHCATFAGYARLLLDMAETCEGYDTHQLRKFCQWNEARCRRVIPGWDELCKVSFD